MARKTALQTLLETHPNLVHSELCKVTSHVQREEDGWYVNTLLIINLDVPFIFKRRKKYKNLEGRVVNLTYYPEVKEIAGMQFETMKVVRIKVS
ncbi:MAG: hypothetical protein ACJAYN_000172 [Bermanella sp.]|jgi:hypothetical protein|uniref:hypothetical protein n=1 Tax=Glaciecola sp. 33A TaxID=2057807 RepID=UPI000C33CC4D|nr:hypothetical protein [Glaciecola sp. 33A]PKI01762.1 hypothetical protein CXF81_10055 [Glaciecola sp. 33A]